MTSSLLLKDPRSFLLAYDDMIAWLQEDNWAMIEDELFGRGVSTGGGGG